MKSCEVAVHFNSTPHSLQDFTFQCIDQISHEFTQVDKFLITKEAYWSAQLFTLSPHGLKGELRGKNELFSCKRSNIFLKISCSC